MIWKTENRYIEGKNFGEKMKGTAQYNNDTLFFLHYSRNKTIIAVLLKERRDDWNVLSEYLSGREKEVVDIMMTLFNEEYILKTYVESREKEASEKTKIGTAQKLYKKGNTIEDIADILDASVKEVEQWLGLVRA